MATKKDSALTAMTGSQLDAGDIVVVTRMGVDPKLTRRMTITEFLIGLGRMAMAWTNTLTTTDGVTGGTARRVGGRVFSQTAASTAITGATETKTMFDQSFTLPADMLKVGTVLRIRAQGRHTATTGSETHAMSLDVGTVEAAVKTGIDPASDDLFDFDMEIVCRTTGATGTIYGRGTMAFGASGTATPVAVRLAETTINTTIANVIGVSIDRQSTATDSDSARLDHLTIDVIG